MQRKVSRLPKVGLLLGALTLLGVAACGGDDDSGDASGTETTVADVATPDPGTTVGSATSDAPGTDAPGPETTDVVTSDAAPSSTAALVDDRDVDPDGTLRIGTRFMYGWDPVTAVNSAQIVWLGLVYDRLVHTNPDTSLVPGLADSWAYSDDGLSVTFNLHPDVEFQDGTTFDAAAVKANLDRARTLDASTLKATLARVDEVVVVDPLTVRLDLNAPDSTLPALMSGLAGVMVSPAALEDPELDQHPVGTGMYELVEFVPDVSFVVERWDGHWDPEAAQAQRIEVTLIADSAARVNAIRTGEIDVAKMEPSDIPALEGADGVSIELNQTLPYVQLAMNLSIPPLDNVLVRQAISHAIDRQTLIDGPFGGYGAATWQPFPEGFPGHVNDLTEAYPYDPERARELLAEAGYPDGFTADTLVVPQPVVYQQASELIMAQLAEVGIVLNARTTQISALADEFYAKKSAPFAVTLAIAQVDPALTVGTRYVSTGSFNPGQYSTPEMEALYADLVATTDAEERTALLEEVSREAVEQALDMPLFFVVVPEAVNDRVVGYEPSIIERPEFRGTGVTP
jgi:peptide/nickel transport system substrate-binding protein